MSATQFNPADWTMDMGKDGVYPFVEDENANITGLGHQDPAAFAEAVNRYDEAMNGEPYPEDERWDADYIGHRWAVLDADGERLLTRVDGIPVTADTPGAVAITTLWGQR